MDLYKFAMKIAKKEGFKIKDVIHKGEYYTSDKIRDLIVEGVYKGSDGDIKEPAVLKVYNDPRIRDDGAAQTCFGLNNRSKILRVPSVFKYGMISPNQGWVIMEKLPENGQFLSSPLDETKRLDFLRLFIDYKKNSPKKPHRPLFLPESLPADEYHCFRISRWLELATQKEAELAFSKGMLPLLYRKEFTILFKKAIDFVRKEFEKSKMVWCAHGHFKPNQIYKVSKDEIYLTDFGHAKMYPEGYELALIIWADWIMAADWRMSYSDWKKGINEWVDKFWEDEISEALDLNHNGDLRASLAERVIGTILADVCATDKPREEKETRLSLLRQLLLELLR